MKFHIIISQKNDKKKKKKKIRMLSTIFTRITTATENILIFFSVVVLIFDKIRLDTSCEWSVQQMIHMKCQVIFSQKNDRKK